MKGAIRFSGIVFMMLMSLGVMIGMGTFLGAGAKNYGVDTNTTFVDKATGMYESLNQTSSSLREKAQGTKSGEFSFLEDIFGAFKVAMAVMGTMFTLIFGGVLQQFIYLPADLLPSGMIPGWLIGLVFTAGAFAVIFAWMNYARGADKI